MTTETVEKLKAEIIRDFTAEELEAELLRRKQEADAAARPRPVKYPDFSRVVAMLERAMQGEDYDDDFEHYLFEEVMISVYGDGIWEWWRNNKCK